MVTISGNECKLFKDALFFVEQEKIDTIIKPVFERYGFERTNAVEFMKQYADKDLIIAFQLSEHYIVSINALDTQNGILRKLEFSLFDKNGYMDNIEECLANLEKDIISGKFSINILYASFCPNQQYEQIQEMMKQNTQGK